MHEHNERGSLLWEYARHWGRESLLWEYARYIVL